MTEEEAIIEMQRMKKAYCNTHTDAQLKKDSKIIDALDMGIKAIKALEQQPKIGHCKECKYFECDSVKRVRGIPFIIPHEICSRWGDGCKTKEDGYCFLFDRLLEEKMED